MHDEALRLAVRRIKALALLREPNYELPADSFLEDAARDIFDAGVAAERERCAKICDRLDDEAREMGYDNNADACAEAIRKADTP